jgi:hypothetical protein
MDYWRQATLTFALAIAGTACDRAPTQGATPAVVEILAPFTSIFENDVIRLTAKVLDAQGAVLLDVPVTWSSSNPNIASVNSFAEVKGLRPGDATITATARDAKGTITIHVDPPPNSVRIVTPQPIIVRTGRSLQLAAEVRDRGGNVLPKAFVSWSVKAAAAPERPGAATVDSAGRLAGATMGSVIITATVGQLAAVVQGYVRSGIAAIEFAADSLRLVLGDQHDVVATDSAGTVISSDVSWELSTNDPAVAAVVGTRAIRAVGVGRTSVRTTAEEKTVVMPVRVETISFASIVPSNRFACGLTAKGEALCWGENDHLQLGVVTPRRCKNEFFCPHSEKSIPVFVSGGLTFTSLAVGSDYVCGITSLGSAYCWGGDELGQLGTSAAVSQCPQSGGSDRCSAVPRAVDAGLNFMAVAGTYLRTCALTSAGAAYCWGGSSTALPELVPGGLTFRSISSGGSVRCATTANDQAYCWGSNESGQLGIGSTGAQQTTPVAVTGGIAFASVGAGGSAACGINTTGKVYCWGGFVELGVSPAPEQCQAGGLFFPCATRATPIASDLTFKDLTVADHMACALTADGAVYCWNSDLRAPTIVTGIPPLRSIRAGSFSACGVTADNVAYCWDRTLNASRAPGQ